MVLDLRGVGEARDHEPGGDREPFWDNVRFIAIALVVVGHSIEKLSDSDLMAALYFTIYVFHMPLFAFVSGRFASDHVGRSAGSRIVTQLLVPYITFSVVWYLIRVALQQDVALDLTRPWSHLWFLFALAVWRLLLPALAALRNPLAFSVLVAVAAGYFEGAGAAFDSGRIFGMLPFFVLGWMLKEDGWPRWGSVFRQPAVRTRTVAAAVLSAAFLVAYLYVDHVRQWRLRGFAQMEQTYADLATPDLWAGPVRLGLLGLAALLGACVLLLAPRTATRITRWGRSTMYVYMLHLFPLYLLRQLTEVESWFDSAPRFALLIVLALAWTCALSSQPVRRAFRWLVEPRLAWLVQPGPSTARVEGRLPPAPDRSVAVRRERP